METEAPASMPQGEQCHTPFFVMDATWELPGTTNHKLPPPHGQESVGKWLHQAKVRRNFHILQLTAIALGAEQVSISIQSRIKGQQP